MARIVLAILSALLVANAVATMERAFAEDRTLDFDRRIAPIFISRCFECHSGPKPRGGLDLSRRQAAIAGGESGPAIVPGQPANSLLWQRIAAGEMPPKKPLAAQEQALIKDWISQGATWGTSPIDPFRVTTSTRAGYDWWSLQPFKRPPLPAVQHATSLRNPIDLFVQAKLEAAGLTLSKQADRRTLIRRLSFDLTGLPPSPDEIAAFVSDPDPRAYERLVDRLLASPHFGEKWARHWLDLARFGESNGFEYDEPRRNAWPYRDWVIDALNRDLPFDEFARQQIAGDVLFPGDAAALTATGFLVAGPYDTAGQNQQSAAMKAVVRQDELEDLVSTVSQTFLGLTAHCARCHDHKFDPIRQSEYYQLTSALGGVRQGERALTIPAEEADRKRRTAERLARIDALTARIDQIDAPVRRAIQTTSGASASASATVDPLSDPHSDSPPFVRPIASWDFERNLRDRNGRLQGRTLGGAAIRDGALRLDGAGGCVVTALLERDLRAKTLEVRVSLATLRQSGGGAMSVQTLDGVVFDAIVFAEREPACWMAGSDNFARTQSFAGPPETEADRRSVVITVTYGADGTITGYRNGRRYGHAYRSSGPVTFRARHAQVLFGLRHGTPATNRMLAGAIEHAALYDRALTPAEVAASAGQQGDSISESAIVRRLPPSARALRQRLAHELDALLNSSERPADRMAHVVTPRQPEPAHFLVRGDLRQPTVVMSPGGVASLIGVRSDFQLGPDAPESRRRRALVRWLTSSRNPLFARVIVNRLWQHHFGIGLVETPNDFGFNGGRPTHSELLDWLAATLVERNWSLKELHRQMVLSATYRQSSDYNPAAAKLDADNRLLWRKSPQRLEAEDIRDAMLAVAGDLQQTIGGPGFRDFKEVLRSGTYTYEPADAFDPAFNRRSVYRTWNRGGRSSLLDAFDCPDPSVTAPRRAVTITPLQALALFNDAFILRMSARLAERADRAAAGDVDLAVARAYQWSFGRNPKPDERTQAHRFVKEQGLPALCRAIFNSNEFLYVD
jgi:hypothetical protein